MKKAKLSVIVIAKNEEGLIGDCLASAGWADEVVLIDTGSTDRTVEIAKKYKAKVVDLPSKKLEFAKWRNRGLAEAKGDFILYVDADERVTPELRREIKNVLGKGKKSLEHTTYEIPRRNFYLGKQMRYGGAWPDYVKRLFWRKTLKRWRRQLHEDPVFEGKLGRLKNPLVHLTHRDLSSMLEKTCQWSKIEAELLEKSGHPPVTWWRLLRIMMTEFWHRGIKLQGLRDGTVGAVEVIFQVFSRFITYARLWEMQEKTKK